MEGPFDELVSESDLSLQSTDPAHSHRVFSVQGMGMIGKVATFCGVVRSSPGQ